MDSLPPVHRTARKAHVCWLCLLTIDVGERYSESVTFDDGTAYTTRGHLECCRYAVSEVPRDPDYGGWTEGRLMEHMGEETTDRDDSGAWWIDAEKTGAILRDYPGLQRQVDALRATVARRNGGRS
jgi:hypothetical protein